MPSLLFLTQSTHFKIDKRVFVDLNINLFFDDKTLETMSSICFEDEIIARQELFRALENESFKKYLNNLRNILLALSQKESAVKNAKSECEKYFQFRLLVEEYIHLLDHFSVMVIPSNCYFISCLSNYAEQNLKNYHRFRELLNEYTNIIKIISFFKTTITTKIIHLNIPQNIGASVNDEIKNCAEDLGISISNSLRNFNNLRLTEDFSNAVISVFPNEFNKLSVLKKQAEMLMDLDVLNLKNEIDFYFSVLDLAIKAKKEKNISHSYPRVATVPKYVVKKAYDVTLLAKNIDTIVPNDIDFKKENSVYFLTGANGGGKTTYLRTCAVNLILFLLGCPVFCEADSSGQTEIYPFHAIFTHFPTDEGYETTGRLEEEAKRVSNIVQQAKEGVFAFFNESFSGANEAIGEKLTFETATKLKEAGAFALFVTHFNKYNYGSFPILNAVIDKTNENKRTFLIRKSSAMEASYANDILKKYGLDKLTLDRKKFLNQNTDSIL